MSERLSLLGILKSEKTAFVASAALVVSSAVYAQRELTAAPEPTSFNVGGELPPGYDNHPCNVTGGSATQEQFDFLLEECKGYFATEKGQKALTEGVPRIKIVTPTPVTVR